jgi:hypothetical protein
VVSSAPPLRAAGSSGTIAAAPRAEPAPSRDEVVPLTATLSRLHTTVSRDVLRKLEAARTALAHARPGATTGDVIDAALDLLLAKQASRRGIVANPRKAARAPGGDAAYIPAEVRRSVWLRDGGRCQYRLASGEICGSTYALEFDHARPSALGGVSTVDNVRVCCRAHNQRRAREVFGDAWMDRFTRGGVPQARSPPAP